MPSGIAALLGSLPTRGMHRRLRRCVPQLDFMAGQPPTFLYTSGRPNRCNPQGVNCLYFSESEATAATEFRAQWRGTPGEDQPKLTYSARVHLRKIVDLGDAAVLKLLGLTATDLFGGWRLAVQSTRLQLLGFAISQQTAITAIRFPSAACRSAGTTGWSVAIFPSAIQPPDRVEILGNTGAALETWP